MDEELFGPDMDLEDIVNAYVKGDSDEKKSPPEPDEEGETEAEVPEDEAEETEDEASEEDEEGSEDDPEDAEDDSGEGEKKAAKAADDEAEVTVTVDGKEHRVSVKDLKRLYGQEAALTQKSQAIASQRRLIESQGLYLAKVLDDRFKAAQAKAAKYKDVDLFRASRELEPEEFDALRAAKEAAESEVAALEREGAEFVQRATQTRAQLLREQAKESLKVITQKIPDWNDTLYSEVRSYAVSQGMDADVVNEIIDPGAIILIHKAMQFDKAQAKKETVTKKVVKAPKKVLSKSSDPDREGSKLKSIRRTAQMSGDIDDVAELFLAATKK